MTSSTSLVQRRRTLASDDRGSIMLAMMAAIVVAGIVFATLSMVAAGEHKTRSDQRYTAAIQGADAGIQDAFVQISRLPANATSVSLQNATGVKVGDVDYTWTATRSSPSAVTWSVTSTATGRFGADTSTRTVAATIAQASMFPMAAFADSTINFNGNNHAVSYPDTGKGIVGTNTSLTLKGSSTTVDGMSLFDTDTAGTDNRCTGQGCPTTSDTVYAPQKLDIKTAVSSTGFIVQQLDACKADEPLTAFVGDSIEARVEPYCFSSFFADTQSFTVTGDPNLSAKVFVDGGDVTLGNKNHADVNYDVANNPSSVRLQIFSTGSTVNVYNQGDVSAAVYAPNAACSGETSNAQTDYWGSMICNTIDNVGGWTFHYDTRLSTLGDGTWHIRGYSEP
jgi:hypothetical protein